MQFRPERIIMQYCRHLAPSDVFVSFLAAFVCVYMLGDGDDVMLLLPTLTRALPSKSLV